MSVGIQKNNMEAQLNFDDIRPYTDSEISEVIEELLRDNEFLFAIKSLRLRWIPSTLFPLFRPLLRWRLRKYASQFKTVADFQLVVETYLQRCMDQTSDALIYTGEDNLDSDRQYLFISNHRDIVMDPALCNLALHRIGRETVRIAIGDNLLSKQFAEHLMRINKSFIVKRAQDNKREWLRELKKLSSYIQKSLRIDNECVWIAQREGRAKDGVDVSDPALIKMLTLSKPKEQPFAEAVAQLNILPIAVSYEWDPCDQAKARELAAKQENGDYQKTEHEDIESIAAGIQGYKGRVDLSFGSPIRGDFESPEEAAKAIDEQILQMYRIQPSHLAAYRQSNGVVPASITETYSDEVLSRAQRELTRRAEQLTKVEAEILLKTYANPVVSRLKLLEKLAGTVSDRAGADGAAVV